MDARLIPSVYDTAKKVIQLEKLKAEFKRCNDLLQCEYEDDDPKTIWRKKKIIRYVDRIAENITHIQTELYGQPKMSKEN